MARVARTLVRLLVVMLAAGAVLAAVVVGVAASADKLYHNVATARDVPLGNLALQPQVPSVIYAADGSVIATLRSSLNRQPVPLGEIAPVMVHALLDTEDHAFFVHGGLDVRSDARALLADVNAGAAVQGGSTIAEQLVKNTYLTDQKTITRKIREAVLAVRLEQKYSKKQILDAYLNSVYLGNGAYGVQAAAKEYFGENASKLDVAQAALLAGLVQAPSGYDPLVNPVGARYRRSVVLANMVHFGTITKAQAAAANATPLPTRVHDAPGVAYTSYGWYVQQVVNELLTNPALGATRDERVSALFTGGLRIYTNEEPGLQAYAQKVAVNDIPLGLSHVVAAFAVINPRNGDVEALIGGPNGTTAQFDDAVQGERQPGSGFKLFTLIGALESGYDVNDTILAASPCAVQFPGVPEQFGYNPQHPMNNDPGDPNGAVTIVQATALSINCAYLRLAHQVTLPKVIAVARSMGLTDPTLNPANPSLVIGSEAVRPIEMAAAYATVADGGIYHTPTFVNRVVDRTGNVIYNGETVGRRIFSQQIASEALLALRATVQYGTGTGAALPNADVAGKTGTTEHSVDAWFNGITPDLASSVWIGDPRGEVPMYLNGVEIFGASYPTQIWHDVAAYALAHTTYSAFPAPDPSAMPPVEYIDSASLQRDDLLSHGYLPQTTTTRPPPTSTSAPAKTRTRPAPPGGAPAPPVTTTTGLQPRVRRVEPGANPVSGRAPTGASASNPPPTTRATAAPSTRSDVPPSTRSTAPPVTQPAAPPATAAHATAPTTAATAPTTAATVPTTAASTTSRAPATNAPVATSAPGVPGGTGAGPTGATPSTAPPPPG